MELGSFLGPAPLPSASSAPQPAVHRAEPEAPLEPVVLPGSSPPEPDEEELPEIPRIVINWEDMDLLMEQLPRGQRHRAERIRGVSLFAEQSLRESCSCT
jgi:hypothetical protein